MTVNIGTSVQRVTYVNTSIKDFGYGKIHKVVL